MSEASVQASGEPKAMGDSLPSASGDMPATGEEATRPAAEAPAGKARRAKPLGKSASAILGDIALLFMQSPAHRHLFLSDLEWLVMPPLLLGQCRVFYAKERPMALALWARVSEAVEKELEQGRARLKPDEWKSGDRLWLVELVAPGAVGKPKVIDALLAQLAKTAFSGESFKALRVNAKTGKREIIRVNSMSRDQATQPTGE